MNILITGCAGFIGYHSTLDLCENKYNRVIGLDNINSYYDEKLKKDRLNIIKKKKNFRFYKIDLLDKKKLNFLFKNNKIDKVIHLAAQAGVRYSFTNPQEYIDSNIIGLTNLLEICKKYKIKYFIFASSSSVYGNTKKFPVKENVKTDSPQSLYAATKKSGELLVATYGRLYNIQSISLRFFTVYGPYGRPDMAIYKFTESIIKEKRIELYNYGKHIRDFTYVDDVVGVINKIINDNASIKNNYEVYNVAAGRPKSLKFFLNIIEKELGIKAKIKKIKLQDGDVYKTYASIDKIKKKFNYSPKVGIESGVKKFINWYLEYNKINK